MKVLLWKWREGFDIATSLERERKGTGGRSEKDEGEGGREKGT